MDMVFLIIVVAITVEGLVEYAKSVGRMFADGAKHTLGIQLGAMLVAVLLCLIFGADVYRYLGVPVAVPWVGCVLTGIFASRGSNYISDLIGRLRKGSPWELAQDVEIVDANGVKVYEPPDGG